MNAITCDVAVCGAGPAGLALAVALFDRGVDVILVDPSFAVWPATYGAWCDELDARIPLAAVVDTPRVIVRDDHCLQLQREYGVIENHALHALWCTRLPAHRRLCARAVDVRAARIVTSLEQRIDARLVIDARGSAHHTCVAAQTAFGVVVDRARIENSALAPSFADGGGIFMDWRAHHTINDDTPTFLYAIPIAEERVLLEETALATSPPMSFDALELRLTQRLRALGVSVDVAACARAGNVERVFIPLDVPVAPASAPFRFGAAGGGVHPATGFSFASSLRAAERVARALAASIAAGANDAHELAEVAHAACWPSSRLVAHRALERGLDALLALDAAETAAFFDAFFALADADVRAFLTGEDGAAVIRAMAHMATRMSPRLLLRVSRAAAFGHRTRGGTKHARRRQEQALARG